MKDENIFEITDHETWITFTGDERTKDITVEFIDSYEGTSTLKIIDRQQTEELVEFLLNQLEKF